MLGRPILPRRLSGVALLLAAALAPTAAAAQDVTLTIPFFGSVSGPAAPFQPVVGPPTQIALEVLARQGIKIEAVTVDSRLDPKIAVSEFQRRAGSAVTIMGPVFSTEFAAVAPIANRSKLPILSGGASNVDLARQNRPWVFMMNPDPRSQAAKGVAAWFKAEPKARKLVLLRDQKDVAAKLQGDLAAEAVAAAGGTVAETISFETGATDFSSLVTRAKASGPDGVVIAALPNEAVAIAIELRQQKLDVPTLVTPSGFVPAFIRNAGEAASGMYTYTSFWSGQDIPAMADFVQRYRAVTGGIDPNFSAAFNYEGWLMLGAALKAAKLDGKPLAQQREDLLKALQTVSITGVQGTELRFNSEGFVDRSMLLLRIGQGGAVSEIK